MKLTTTSSLENSAIEFSSTRVAISSETTLLMVRVSIYCIKFWPVEPVIDELNSPLFSSINPASKRSDRPLEIRLISTSVPFSLTKLVPLWDKLFRGKDCI